MALNTWWDGDPEQRYWMEVATTGSMGEKLIAPKVPGGAWTHELVSYVRPGDRVLHWEGIRRRRRFIGWSVATAEPEVVPDYVSPNAGIGDPSTEGWMVPLGGLNIFANPLSLADVRGKSEAVLDVRAAHPSYRYFPFYPHGGTLRTQQGYLLKFPEELFDVFPGLNAARIATLPDPAEDELDEESKTPGAAVPRGRTTRVQDPKLRSAIENHAVDLAIEHYTAAGGSAFEKLGKPYDVKLTLDGQERHVEVKGSSLSIETVELTINEVTHAEGWPATDLVVVDQIVYQKTPDGDFATSGGRLRIWQDWTPHKDDLQVRKLAYSLPDPG